MKRFLSLFLSIFLCLALEAQSVTITAGKMFAKVNVDVSSPTYVFVGGFSDSVVAKTRIDDHGMVPSGATTSFRVCRSYFSGDTGWVSVRTISGHNSIHYVDFRGVTSPYLRVVGGNTSITPSFVNFPLINGTMTGVDTNNVRVYCDLYMVNPSINLLPYITNIRLVTQYKTYNPISVLIDTSWAAFPYMSFAFDVDTLASGVLNAICDVSSGIQCSTPVWCELYFETYGCSQEVKHECTSSPLAVSELSLTGNSESKYYNILIPEIKGTMENEDLFLQKEVSGGEWIDFVQLDSINQVVHDKPVSAAYRLKFVDINGAEQFSNKVELKRENFTWNLFPNPATDNIFVTASDESKLVIYDLLGQVVLKSNLIAGENDINVTEFVSGVYIVKVICRGEMFSKKLIKD